jgi:hypothetical protein
MPESKEEEEEMLQGRNDGRDAFGNSTQSLWRCDTCNRECDWVRNVCFSLIVHP